MNNVYSKDIEDSILGCILIDNDLAKNIKKLSEDDFFDSANKQVFLAIKTVYESGKTPDIFTVKEKMAEKFNAENSLNYLNGLIDKVISTFVFEQHIEILKNYSVRRKILLACQQIEYDIVNCDTSEFCEDIKKNVINKISAIKTNNINNKIDKFSEILYMASEDIEKKYNKREDISYKTGIFDLDSDTYAYDVCMSEHIKEFGRNVKDIWSYVFSEMVNNVMDHSMATKARIIIKQDYMKMTDI